jgi:hypothetical protein
MSRKASMNVELLDLVRRYRIWKLGHLPRNFNHPGTFETLEIFASNSNVHHGLTILGELPDRQMKCPNHVQAMGTSITGIISRFLYLYIS